MAEEASPLFDASPEEVWTLLEVGQIYYLRREFDKAEKVFRGALVLSPGNGDLYAALGAALHVQKKHEEALECYEKALKVCPSESCSKANRGELLLLAGKTEEALKELKETIEQQGDGHPLSERAKVLLNIAEAQQATS
jgi:tetratricopeptide (TPR) repeat protein